MMHPTVVESMNKQINLEMYSGFLYLSLSIQMEKLNYKGFSKWLADHYLEELTHASDFIEFMQKRNVSAELMNIQVEKFDLTKPLDVANVVLAHEKKVTQSIYNIHDIAKKHDDYATEIFMHKYINEQIEEEALALDIVDKFTFAGDNVAAQYSVDKEFLRGACGCNSTGSCCK